MSLQLCFAFRSELLEDHGQEQNFEMAKARLYASSAAEVESSSKKIMYTSDVCPEMTHMVIKAKKDYPDLWPPKIDEYSVAELIFKLKAECRALSVELENLRKAFPDRETKQKECRSESPTSTLAPAPCADLKQQEQLLDSHVVPHNYSYGASLAGGPTLTSSAAPGINTILEYVEGNKAEISQLAMPTLTVNMRDRVDRICQLFAEGDNSSNSLSVPTSTALPKPTSRGLQIHHEEPTALVPVPEQSPPKRLAIYRDPGPGRPVGAAVGHPPAGSRAPLRQLPVAPQWQPEDHPLPVEVRDTATNSPPRATTTFTLPIKFDPVCASTAVFHHGIGEPLPAEPVSPVCEMDCCPSPSPPRSPPGRCDLAEAFAHVHTPTADASRARVDATNFIEAFLSAGGGTLLTEKTIILQRWADHFRSVLNRPSAVSDAAIARLSQVEDNVDLDLPPSLHETIRALQQLSSYYASASRWYDDASHGQRSCPRGIRSDQRSEAGPRSCAYSLQSYVLCHADGPSPSLQDTLKISLKRLQINPANWEDLARDRPTWRRTVTTGTAIYEANRVIAAKAKRKARKSQ
ncbi:hypothetical protein SprV_0501838200 [Sparganum proliferum]